MSRRDEETVAAAVEHEQRLHEKKLAWLRDPEFVEGGRIGLEQERRGDSIPLAEARRRAQEYRAKR